MAKIFAPPKEVGVAPAITHPFNWNAYQKDCDKYVQSVKDWAKRNGSSECAGEEIRFGVADGNACYIVKSLKPVVLIHLPIGDAWQFQYAHLLTAKAVREEVRRRHGMAELFGRKG